MNVFNAVVSGLFDLLLGPFRAMSPWIAMAVVSLLTGFLMLYIYRLTSNQDGIRRVKNLIKAHLLELRLFKNDLAVSLRAQGSILAANLKYIGYAFKPLLVMIVPVLIILIQLNDWFGSRPLQVGERALVIVRLAESYSPTETDLRLEAPAGLVVETPPLRIEEDREVDWRIRAESPGVHDVTLRWGDQSAAKKVVVGDGRLARVSTARVRTNAWREISHPGERSLPSDAPLKTFEVRYPERRLNLFGIGVHWLVAYFILSVVLGFAFKGVFKVTI
jgi:uncharacterized membrane protein (DUF106 family)